MAQVPSNVVGYQTIGLNASTFKMVGVQFSDIGADTGLTLNELVTGNIPFGTQIQILKPSGTGYDYYTYLEEAWDDNLGDFVTGWADGSEEIATVTLATGKAFWLKAPSACDVSLLGEVLGTNKPISATAKQFGMIANPYPITFTLNDISWTGLTYGDQVQVLKPSGSGYDYYTYLEEAWDDNLGDFVVGWADGSEEIMTTPIAVGQGFWINPDKAVSANFVTPL